MKCSIYFISFYILHSLSIDNIVNRNTVITHRLIFVIFMDLSAAWSQRVIDLFMQMGSLDKKTFVFVR